MAAARRMAHALAVMPVLAKAGEFADLTSRFLTGLAPADRGLILSAAKERRYRARAAITSQDAPAGELRLLNEWQRNRALVKRRGKLVLRAPERMFAGVTDDQRRTTND